MRRLLQTGMSGLLVLAIMLLGGLVLWVVIPVGWLYIGSLVQGRTQSLGAALGVIMIGLIVSIALVLPALGWLSHKHAELRIARGLDDLGQTALEAVLTISAGVAAVGFGAWFFLLSGSSPLPTGLGF